MLIPIRCFTCGGILADKWKRYQMLVEKHQHVQIKNGAPRESLLDTQYIERNGDIPETPEYLAMKELGINRMCCRRHMLTSVNLMSII
jgi:DNA-directed RNA polymerase subunit N (RpoN/RPB10)